MTNARLAEIRLHPIKSLDAVSVRESRIGPGGGLEFDRVWALYSADGRWVNGKSTPAIHQIYSSNDFNRDGLELIRRGYAMIGARKIRVKK